MILKFSGKLLVCVIFSNAPFINILFEGVLKNSECYGRKIGAIFKLAFNAKPFMNYTSVNRAHFEAMLLCDADFYGFNKKN